MISSFDTIPDADLDALEKTLGYHFKRRAFLVLALTHTSWANERGLPNQNNERQEFLGDAILELCISWELYQRFPELREGELTALRAQMVNAENLAHMSKELGLDKVLRLGKGEDKQGGRTRSSVLSDTFESVMAAIYEDGGFTAVQKCVAQIFASHWPSEHAPLKKDYKTRLQELSQKLFKELPVYTQLSSNGPDHARIFKVSLKMPDGQTFIATGSGYKKAAQEAACNALAIYGREE